MKLTAEELKRLAFGYVYTDTDEEGYLHFCRFSPEAQEFYKSIGPDSAYRQTLRTAGVRLEFTTDATALSFTFKTEAVSSVSYLFFDVYVDGVLLAHPGFKGTAAQREQFSLSLKNGTHRVAVYLPYSAITRIKDFELTDATFVTPEKKGMTLLCLGDSITQGYSAEYPSQIYANLLADKLNAHMVNQGISGEVFRPEMISATLPFTPDVITVAYGTNDWFMRDRETVTQSANAFFATLKKTFPTSKIFAVTPIFRADSDKQVAFGPFEDVIRTVRDAASAQEGIILLDGLLMTPHLPAFFEDGFLHPNDLGFRFYAEGLYGAMLPHLK